jgi:hypothetical protein
MGTLHPLGSSIMAHRDGSRNGVCGPTLEVTGSQIGIAAAAAEVPPGPAMPDAAPAADAPKMNTQWEFLYRVAERFGMPTIILLLLLWWVRNDFLKPLLEAHYEVIGRIVDGQKAHTERLDSIGRKLDELISVSSQR